MEGVALTVGRIVLVLGAAAGAAALVASTPPHGGAIALGALVAMVAGLAVARVWAALLPLAVVIAWLAVSGDAPLGIDASPTGVLVVGATLTLFLLAGVGVGRMKPETARRVGNARAWSSK
jgi:hypothetical protein